MLQICDGSSLTDEPAEKQLDGKSFPSLTYPLLLLLPVTGVLFIKPKEELSAPKERVLFPNISIINQSFSKIQWSLQNFPLNQLPLRIQKVLGAKFQAVSCRF